MEYIVECTYCGKSANVDKPSRKFCNKDCYLAHKKSNAVWELECTHCGKDIIRYRKPQNMNAVFCSSECLYGSKRKVVEVTCFVCRKKFERQPSKLVGKKHVYCSDTCAGKGYSILYSGENSARFNPNLTEVDRIIARKYPEYREWRDRVYSRDSYTCRKCSDSKGGNLVAHHIYNYSGHEKLRTALLNGVTLCKPCHKLFHDTFGYTNNDIMQIELFLMQTIPSQAVKKLTEGVTTNAYSPNA